MGRCVNLLILAKAGRVRTTRCGRRASDHGKGGRFEEAGEVVEVGVLTVSVEDVFAFVLNLRGGEDGDRVMRQ